MEAQPPRHTNYPAGIDAAMLREREKLVFKWSKQSGVPIAFVLAGGYSGVSLTQPGLVELHRFTIEAATLSSMISV